MSISGSVARGHRARAPRWRILLLVPILTALFFPPSIHSAQAGPLSRPAIGRLSGAQARAGDARGRGKAVLAPPADLPPGTTILPATLVRTTLTSSWLHPAPDPSGIDYWPAANRLVITDSEIEESVGRNLPAYWDGYNVFITTTLGSLTGNCTTYTGNPGTLQWNDFMDEPAGFAINTDNGHFYFSSDGASSRVYDIGFGPDGTYCTSDDTVTRVLASNVWGTTDAEDLAYGNNTLFISDGVNGEVYSIPLGADGVPGTPDDGNVTHWDTTSKGFSDTEGIGYNSNNNTLFVVSTKGVENYLGEFTPNGTLLRAYDLSFMGTTNNIRSDVVWAPSSQTPGVKSIYIVSRGVDNNTDRLENDGKIWEISLGGPSSAFGKVSPVDGLVNRPLTLNLDWDASTGATSYEYCLDTTNDDACSNWISSGAATNAVVSGLTPAQTYYWQARAIHGSGTIYADGSATDFWSFTTMSTLDPPWAGSATVTSNRPVVAVIRPHIGGEVASYNGVTGGSLTAYVPMLFKGSFGGAYDSALDVENVDPTQQAAITIKFHDSQGNLSCTLTDSLAPRATKEWWVPSLGCLPAGWVGGAVVTSNQAIIAVGRPHIGGEVMTYNGFSSGSLTSYVPMLFKGSFGGSYNAAFYVQNVDAGQNAGLTIRFYDNAGNLSCTITDSLAPLASKGWWVLAQTCLPMGWVGGAVITSSNPVVSIGRVHVGSQVTTYSGFAGGAPKQYVPMLFKGAFGGSYDAAFYVQNVDPSSTAGITIKYYDSGGNLSCTRTDSIPPLASIGWWVPAQSCLPPGWVGGAVVTSNTQIVAVGRPHVGGQVTTYASSADGSPSLYLPMLFKQALGGSYDSAFYIQNADTANAADVTVRFYNMAGILSCEVTDNIPAQSTLGYWIPSLICDPP